MLITLGELSVKRLIMTGKLVESSKLFYLKKNLLVVILL